jgi:hypothetical protein
LVENNVANVTDLIADGMNWTFECTANSEAGPPLLLNSSQTNVTNVNCTGGCLYITDASDNKMAIFDKYGNMDIVGALSTGASPTETDGSFYALDSANTIVAKISSVAGGKFENPGDMSIIGNLYEAQNSYCTPPANSFVIRDNSNNCVAYINTSGDLWLRGLSSQGSII